jgi:HSP20 family protein
MTLRKLSTKEKGSLARREWESPLESLHEEMENLFDRFFWGTGIEPRRAQRSFIPTVNVSEDEKEILVTADLPGMEQKDVEVTITKDSLTIRGEKKEETEEKDKNFYRMERSYGSFERIIPLSSEIEETKTKATFKNGVLKINLPKTGKSPEAVKKINVVSE